jgi:hypothetical protein
MFRGSYEDFLSELVENVGDRAFYALPFRDVVFDEFSFGLAKEEEVTWREVRAVSRVHYPLDLFGEDIQWIVLNHTDVHCPGEWTKL